MIGPGRHCGEMLESTYCFNSTGEKRVFAEKVHYRNRLYKYRKCTWMSKFNAPNSGRKFNQV